MSLLLLKLVAFSVETENMLNECILYRKERTERNAHSWQRLATWVRRSPACPCRSCPGYSRLFFFIRNSTLTLRNTVIKTRTFPWNVSPLQKHLIKTFPSHSNFNLCCFSAKKHQTQLSDFFLQSTPIFMFPTQNLKWNLWDLKAH